MRHGHLLLADKSRDADMCVVARLSPIDGGGLASMTGLLFSFGGRGPLLPQHDGLSLLSVVANEERVLTEMSR